MSELTTIYIKAHSNNYWDGVVTLWINSYMAGKEWELVDSGVFKSLRGVLYKQYCYDNECKPREQVNES